MNAMGEKKYTFMVHPEATKSQIKEAVEKMFEGTKVKSVNTMNLDGKNKTSWNEQLEKLLRARRQSLAADRETAKTIEILRRRLSRT